MSIETKIDVRYPDCDSMKIAHHAVYPIWYEMGRMDFFEKMGFGYAPSKALGVDPAMVNLELKYGAPVSYPGNVIVKTTLTICSGKKLGFHYDLFREGEDTPCASANSFHIWVKDGKSVNIETDYPQMFNAYVKALEE